MTAIKAKSEDKIILNFSDDKCSKNHIKQSLRRCEIINIEETGRDELIIYNNDIKVGMYTIRIDLPFDSHPSWNKLKDYADFQISIYDSIDKKNSIDLNKDTRFKNQYWVSQNFFGKLRIKHLIDIIAYCHRLNKLKAFL